jgi:hypothetical protein
MLEAAAANAISRRSVTSTAVDTPTETFDTREVAALILNGGENFKSVGLLFFSPEVLSSIDMIQKCLQTKEKCSHHAMNQLGFLT